MNLLLKSKTGRTAGNKNICVFKHIFCVNVRSIVWYYSHLQGHHRISLTSLNAILFSLYSSTIIKASSVQFLVTIYIGTRCMTKVCDHTNTG